MVLKIPRNVPIARSITITAPQEKVFPYLMDPRLIMKWNPFVLNDPEAKVEYRGTSGQGSAWSWQGRRAGEGSAEIIEVQPFKKVSLKLDMKKPFKATNYGAYEMDVQGPSITVTWSVNETALIPRLISAFVNLDSLVGKEFEHGLRELKRLLEADQGSATAG